MLDEFPALGRLDFFETALAYLAGYGVRALLIAQMRLGDIAFVKVGASTLIPVDSLRGFISSRHERPS